MFPERSDNSRHKAVQARVQKSQRRRHFLAAWMRSLLKVGAVVPSSRRLSSAMAGEVDVNATGMVVDLGAGTGVMTSALLYAGVRPERMVVVERDPKLHALLVAHFPQLRVICGDAMQLRQLLAEHGIGNISAIVSSLPLLGMPKEVRHTVESQMLELVQATGATLVQFTYGPQSPVSVEQLHKHHVVGRRKKFIMANIPPAQVWAYHNR